MGNYDSQVMKLAGQQHFVVSREQLLDIGSPRQIERRMKCGLIERVHESVYRVAGSQRSWRQSLIAACFAGGKYSVASFRSAAQLWDLPGGAEICEITSPRHRRARHDGIVPHESRFLTDRDVTYIDNIPVTRPARLLNDLGLLVEQSEMSVQEYDHAMLEAVRRNLVDLGSVWAEWEILGGAFRVGSTAVEAMLKGFVPPSSNSSTKPELRLLQLVREAGLAEPVQQFRVWLSPARWFDLDLAWPDLKVFAEFDPYKWHGDRKRYQATIARRLEVESRFGWRGVPITDDELDAGCPLALPLLSDLLGRR